MIWAGLGLVVVLAAVAIWVRRRLVAVTVTGNSMLPRLGPGTRVLVRRTRDGVARGDIVVFARPRTTERAWMIKRVLAVPGDPVPRREAPVLWGHPGDLIPARHLVVIGDNPAESYDSREFGYLRAEALLGVVVGQLSEPARNSGPGRIDSERG